MQNDKDKTPAGETPSNPEVVGKNDKPMVSSNKASEGGVPQREGESQVQVNTRLQNALIDENVEKGPLPSESETKPRKKVFPKMIIFSALFFLILGVLIFLFLKFQETGTRMLLGNKGEIVWWGMQHDASVYQPLIDKFEKENPGIKIRYIKQSTQDYRVRLVNALVSGKGPDIFEIHNTWPVMLKDELSTLPSSVMSNEEFIQNFYPIIVSNLTLDKGVVGMPLEYDALTLFINDDVFTSALKSPPDYWDELRVLASQLTQVDQRKVIIQGGVALGTTVNIDHWQEVIGLLLIQNGVNPARPTGALATSALSFYKDFSGRRVWSNTLPNSTVAFSRGELAMYFGPTRRASEIIKANPGLRFRTVKLPQLRKNNPDDPNYSYATYWVHAVSERSKLKEGAWAFLKFLSREDSLREINENITKFDTIGRAYPRPEMNAGMLQDPVFGSIIYFAYDARSFYLADNTYDGSDGINSLVNNLYKSIIDGRVSEKVLTSKSQELSQILGRFGVRVR